MVEDYRYDTFRAALLLNDARFSPDSLEPGQGQPVLLVTGSLTCPLTISSLPLLGEMNRLYGDRVIFAFVYTREAHPGENVRQPVTLEEKVEHARLLQEIHSVDWPVLVDDLDGTLHRALDTKQNSVHIFQSDGTLIFRALFAGDNAVEEAIEAVAGDGCPHRNSLSAQDGRPYEVDRLHR